MKNRTACFTGHRVIPVPEKEKISRRLWDAVEQMIKDGYCYFGAGGALGFDTLAAETVLALKGIYPHVKLILVLPCPEQARGWSIQDKEQYEKIKEKADKVVYTSSSYTRGCMHKRNRHLVDYSSTCICYLTEDSGGTYYTVSYALKQGLRIINIGE